MFAGQGIRPPINKDILIHSPLTKLHTGGWDR